MSEKSIFYFDRPGPANTDKTLEAGIKRVLDLKIGYLVVPSITGRTALKASEKVRELGEKKKLDVVCVTFRAGGAWKIKDEPPSKHWKEIPDLKERWEEWKEEGLEQVTFDKDIEKRLMEMDVPIVRSTDLGASIEASMEKDLGVSTNKKILKETLYLFSPGLKVSVLTSLMAADAGEIPTDEEVISFGGIEQGVDTAIVIKPAYSDKVFSTTEGLEIREIICKPRSMKGKSGDYSGRGWD
ncbi:MAG: hypothetical protein KGY66_06120 [Candidatus Thermoplasmatota archaeon]|nr:hypothetical protein [Candidatus Thermoplasmatota archaeon]